MKNQLVFEGEYLNGERNGIGKEYNCLNGDLEYEGEYLNGEKHGKGKQYYYGKLEYEGEFLNGKKHGKGKQYFIGNGRVKFEGEFLNEKIWSGKGYNINGKLEYELKDGQGKIKEYFYNDTLRYEGEYLNGERNGKGKEYCDNKI